MRRRPNLRLLDGACIPRERDSSPTLPFASPSVRTTPRTSARKLMKTVFDRRRAGDYNPLYTTTAVDCA